MGPPNLGRAHTQSMGETAVRTLRATSLIVALAVGSLGIASPAAALDATWQDPPLDLSTSEVDVWGSSATMVAGPAGSLMSMWIETGPSESQLRATLWSDGAWSTDAPAFVSAPSYSIDDLQVVSRGDGSFIALWVETFEDLDYQATMTVMSSVFDEGSWSLPNALMIGEVDDEVSDLHLAAAPDGSVIAAWDNEGIIEAAALGATGTGAVQILGEGNDPEVAASPTNVLAVTWRADVSTYVSVPAAVTVVGSTWSPTVYLSDADSFAPELGASPTGFVTMWMEGNDRLPWASTFTGTSWSAPVAMLDDNQIGGGVTAPGLVVATPGVTAVTWSDGEFSNAIIWLRTFNGTAWSAPVELLDATQVGLEHEVVGSPDGTFTVVWRRNGGGPLMARTFTATTLGEPFELSAAENSPSNPRLEAASNGYVVATWQQGGSVVARMFDGESWGESLVDFGSDSTPEVASTTDNVFFVAWEWYSDDRGLIRTSWLDTPDTVAEPGGSGGEELAATGPAPFAGIGAVGAALALLMGAVLLAAPRRRTASSTR